MISPDDKRFLDLLQKWQDGDFTRSDEQELQALTGEDDFRKEAWEGFQLHPEEDHDYRLAALRRSINPEKGGRRVLFPQMAAIAAALVLVLAALWFFRTPAPQPELPIAKNETPAETPTATDQTMSDALPGAEVAPRVPSELKQDAIAKALPQKSIGDVPETRAASKTEEKDEAANVATTAAAPPIVQPDASTAESESKDVIAYQNTNDVKEEQDFANDKVSEKKKVETMQKPGAVTARRENAPTGNVMRNVDDNLVALQNYLNQNARLPEAARQNNVSGYVRIGFRLEGNPKQPTAFRVVRGMGYGCDEEAMRVLRTYRYWRDFTQDTLTVEVPFIR